MTTRLCYTMLQYISNLFTAKKENILDAVGTEPLRSSAFLLRRGEDAGKIAKPTNESKSTATVVKIHWSKSKRGDLKKKKKVIW